MQDKVPQHVAMIMDGNGRWAKKRGLARVFGHRQGVNTLISVVEHTIRRGIRYLTVFAFSTENWKRPAEEVDALMGLLVEFTHDSLRRLKENGVRVVMLGDIDALPAKARESAYLAMEETRENTRLQVNIAINYGGRADIARAARRLAEMAAAGQIDPSDIDEAMVADQLYTAGVPDVDLLIRTSGELRISNFLLYQIAYSEIYVAPELWPDFDDAAYDRALASFGKRERRFGAVEG